MRAPLAVLGALLALGPGVAPMAAGSEAAPLVVHVRVEGKYALLWEGDVALGETFTLVAANSGRAHTLPARTPLGALWAAAQQGGFALEVSDGYSDFVALRVAGEYWWGTWWWDYRVDWVQTNYGAQAQWLAWGPALRDGASVLWYPETAGSTPLRLTAVGPALGAGPCARAQLVEAPLLDPLHQPGQPWPELTWRPAQLARLRTHDGSEAPVALGAGVALVEAPGWVWADDLPLPGPAAWHYVRSPRSWLPCPDA